MFQSRAIPPSQNLLYQLLLLLLIVYACNSMKDSLGLRLRMVRRRNTPLCTPYGNVLVMPPGSNLRLRVQGYA